MFEKQNTPFSNRLTETRISWQQDHLYTVIYEICDIKIYFLFFLTAQNITPN